MFTEVRFTQVMDQNDKGTGSRTSLLTFHLHFHFLQVALSPVWSSLLTSAYKTLLFIQGLTQVFPQVFPDWSGVQSSPTSLLDTRGCILHQERALRGHFLVDAGDGKEQESLRLSPWVLFLASCVT